MPQPRALRRSYTWQSRLPSANYRPIAEDYVPTYQYVCTDCGSDLEAVQSFSEASLTECPTCGGKLRKRFGAVGVVFKGSGFYRNDSRTDRPGGSDRKPEPASVGADKGEKGSAKSDAKSDSSVKSSSSSDSGSSSSSSSSSSPSSGNGSSSGSGATSKSSSAA